MAKHLDIVLKNGTQFMMTERKMLFCQYYLADKDRNATKAAIAAGYSPKTAGSMASRLLKDVNIKAYLNEKTQSLLERLDVTQERVLSEFVKLGFSDVSDYFQGNLQFKPLSDLNKNQTGAIQSIEVTDKMLKSGSDKEGGVTALVERKVKFKLHDKFKSLERLAELTGLIDKTEDPKDSVINQYFSQFNSYIKLQ